MLCARNPQRVRSDDFRQPYTPATEIRENGREKWLGVLLYVQGERCMCCGVVYVSGANAGVCKAEDVSAVEWCVLAG